MDKRGSKSRNPGKDGDADDNDELLMHTMKGTTLIVLKCEEGWLTGSDCRVTCMKDGIEKVKSDTRMKSILARHRNHMVMMAGYVMVSQTMAGVIRSFIYDNGDASLEDIWSCNEHKIKKALTDISQIYIDRECDGVVLVVDRRRRDRFLEITAIRAKGEEEFKVSKAYKNKTVVGSGEPLLSKLVSLWKCPPYSTGKEIMTYYMQSAAYSDSSTGGYMTIHVGGPSKEWTWVGAKLLENKRKVRDPPVPEQKIVQEAHAPVQGSDIPTKEAVHDPEVLLETEIFQDLDIPQVLEQEIVQDSERKIIQDPDVPKKEIIQDPDVLQVLEQEIIQDSDVLEKEVVHNLDVPQVPEQEAVHDSDPPREEIVQDPNVLDSKKRKLKSQEKGSNSPPSGSKKAVTQDTDVPDSKKRKLKSQEKGSNCPP